MQGYGPPHYTNVRDAVRDACRRDVPADNPTGLYRREFKVPRGWRGRRIVLHFGGAESALHVWVNGQPVGICKDSRLPAEFDVTEHVRHGRERARRVVVRWSDASYVEDQDQWWHAGIARGVSVARDRHRRRHRGRVRARRARTTTCRHGLLARPVDVGGERRTTGACALQLETPGGRTVVDRPLARHRPHAASPRRTRDPLRSPRPWSAEDPTLLPARGHAARRGRAATRRQLHASASGRVEIRDRQLLVNGAPMLHPRRQPPRLRRHRGRVVTREQMRADLVLMKQFSFNAVRTSHYPNDPYCSTSATSSASTWSTRRTSRPRVQLLALRRPAVRRRASSSAAAHGRARQEPPVRSSSGRSATSPATAPTTTRSPGGSAATTRRARCTTRARSCETGSGGQTRDRRALPDVPGDRRHRGVGRAATDDARPLILCEYSHAMGNCNGGLAEYWDAIESPRAAGRLHLGVGDHGLRQRADGAAARTAYGGDFGDEPNDANFCIDGMVWPDRAPHPALHSSSTSRNPCASRRSTPPPGASAS